MYELVYFQHLSHFSPSALIISTSTESSLDKEPFEVGSSSKINFIEEVIQISLNQLNSKLEIIFFVLILK